MRWWIGGLIVLNLVVLLAHGVMPTDSEAGESVLPDKGSLLLLSEQNRREPAVPTGLIATGSAPAQSLASPQVEAPKPKTSPKPKPAPLPVPVVKPEQCWLYGDFQTKSDAEAWSVRRPPGLDLAGIKPHKVSRVAGYYVLVPAASNRTEAKATLAKLRKVGVKDTWLFAAGPLKNSISLGLFSRQTNAQQRARQLQAKGFAVVVRDKYRDVVSYQLLLKGKDNAVTRQGLRELGGGKKLQEVACE